MGRSFINSLLAVCLTAAFLAQTLQARSAGRQETDSLFQALAGRLRAEGLGGMNAYAMLLELVSRAGSRLSGSPGAAAAVAATEEMMMRVGADRVWREQVMVPRWVRGGMENAQLRRSKGGAPVSLTVCALGGSISTPEKGITAGVLEVRSFEELTMLGSRVKGKIVFFNRPMDPTVMDPFEAYGGAVDQRSKGAVEAGRLGAVAVLVRSVTTAHDDVPHTGSMGYADSVRKIPAAAVSTVGADMLSRLLRVDSGLTIRLRLSARTLPDIRSANVLGEIRGWEKPEEIVLVGGHLDSWDKGTGAHDDASGCVQAIEVLHLVKRLGIRPRRTIRAVMFMNEENGMRGGLGYAQDSNRAGETHVALIESDRGGFAPRGFTLDADSLVLQKVRSWEPLFEPLNAGRFARGYSGVDISSMVKKGVPGFGLLVEAHRYFDYHHSANDTIDKVNPRELEIGAVVEALLCLLISERGL